MTNPIPSGKDGMIPHLVCERCGAVQEISDARVERAVRAMAVESGFRAREHHLEIVGVCERCQSPG